MANGELDVFIGMVRNMRAKQLEYFSTRSPGTLREAKDYERRVDAWLKAHAESKRPNLFGGGDR